VLDRLALGHLQPVHDRRHALGSEDPQQRIFEREKEPARTRITLTSRAAAQLIVDASGLVALGTNDMQAPGFNYLGVQQLPVVPDLLSARLLRGFVQGLIGEHCIDFRVRISAQHDIRTATGHVGRYRDHLRPSCLNDNFRFAGMLLGIKHVVRQRFFLQQVGEQF